MYLHVPVSRPRWLNCHGKCANVVPGGFLIYRYVHVCSYILLFLRGGGLRKILSKDIGVAYTSEYGVYMYMYMYMYVYVYHSCACMFRY